LGGTYRLTLTNTCCAIDGSTLADATLAEAEPGALLGSLLAAESAWDAGLPDAAIPGVLQAFRIDFTATGSAAAALAQSHDKLRLALIVESYVGEPDGLAHDRARIAHFSAEALSGRIGNDLLVAMQAEPGQQRDLIAGYQALLERSLDDLIQAVRDARDNGDYAFATELMELFFQVCVDITAANEWQARLEGHRQARR
jgi:hypothetical protein